MKNFTTIIVVILFALSSNILFSQGSAGVQATYESRFIVDMPTAGTLEKGTFALYTNAYQNGGIMLFLDIAPFKDFAMGLSYSGTNIIGSGALNFQSIPGIHIKYRIVDETLSIPAILIGANTQGRGDYNKSDKRYETLSPGIFLALSKNYKWFLGSVAFHGGINYTFESNTESNLPNVYGGIEHSIGKNFSFNLEFNPSLNDANNDYISGIGLLNASLRWSLAAGITLELQARDLFLNMTKNKYINRAVCLEYISNF